jgi:hypothetical protein
VLVGGCVPFADGELPFAPAVEALRDLVGQVGVERVRVLAGPSWPEPARLFELLLGLLGALADRAALVVVLEDVHWADRATRDLVAYLARNLRRQRVVLVATHRSDEPAREWLGPLLAELGVGGRVEAARVAHRLGLAG